MTLRDHYFLPRFQIRKLRLRNVKYEVTQLYVMDAGIQIQVSVILKPDFISYVKLPPSLILSPSHFIKHIHLHSPEQTCSHSRIENISNLLEVH